MDKSKLNIGTDVSRNRTVICGIIITLLSIFIPIQLLAGGPRRTRPGWIPPRFHHYKPFHPQRVIAPRANKQNISDPKAVQILKHSFLSKTTYLADQHTQQGVHSANETVASLLGNRQRIDFLTPAGLAGDFIITAPGTYIHYYARRHDAVASFWTVINGGAGKKAVLRMIQKGKLIVRQTGWERVAGVTCAIITVSSNPSVDVQRKLWIDTSTGIIMKREVWNKNGMVSDSYLTHILIGDAAGLTLRDFTRDAIPPGTNITPTFPGDLPSLGTVSEAQPQVPFHILEPNILPAGYYISGLWVLHVNRQNAVLIRFSHGANHFSLYERIVPKVAFWKKLEPPKHPKGYILMWKQEDRDMVVHVTYVGHLTPAELSRSITSLH